MPYGNTSYYVDPGDSSAKNMRAMMDHYYQSAYTANSAFWQQAAIDKRFKVGDQSFMSFLYGNDQYSQSHRFFLNLIASHINMVVGYQRRNRKSTVVLPTIGEDALADQYNRALKWCEDRDGFQEYQSQSFEGACDTGINLLHLYLDYTKDPVSGDLMTDQVAYNNFLIDPYFRKQDLTDCTFVWRRRWVNKQGAKNLLPGMDKEIDKMQPSRYRDGRFPLQAELVNLDMNNVFSYDEFYYRSFREAEMIIDPISQETVEWTETNADQNVTIEEVLAQQPWLKRKKTEVPTVKLCIALGDQIVYNGTNLLEVDSYPFVPTLAYHEPDMQSYAWRFRGIVRNMRDPQYLYNVQKIMELDIVQSQVTSGWIYPVDVVTDPKCFRQTGQGFIIPLKSGRSPSEIQRIEPPQVPQSLMELSQSLSDLVTKIPGINEELMGNAVDDKAGILAMLRQGAGLTTLQTLFDKLDYTQRLYGKLRLDAIIKNFTPAKIQMILGEEADPRFFSDNSLKFSFTVEEGNYSTTQRQNELQQLLHFKEIGMPISDTSILRAAFITNKKQVIADIEQQQQAQAQAQQQESEMAQQEQQMKMMQAYAKAKVDLAKEKDLISKTVENEAAAEQKSMAADLDLVRMMINLEDLDFEQFRKAFEMAEMVKQANEPQTDIPAVNTNQPNISSQQPLVSSQQTLGGQNGLQ